MDKELLKTRQIMVAANFRLPQRDYPVILHKICNFQPFLKFELCKKCSCGPPFAKMPKMTDFSCLGNLPYVVYAAYFLPLSRFP